MCWRKDRIRQQMLRDEVIIIPGSIRQTSGRKLLISSCVQCARGIWVLWRLLVKRSARRRKTIQARMVAGKMEVLAPAPISDSDLQGHIDNLRSRLENKVYPKDDAHLRQRASYSTAGTSGNL